MRVGTGFCNQRNSWDSGRLATDQALQNGHIDDPGLVLAFCSAQTDPTAFFLGVQSAAGAGVPIIGGSAIGIITNTEISYAGCPCGVIILQSDAPFCRTASADGIDASEYATGRRLAESLRLQSNDRALLVFYDSIKNPPGHSAPPVLNASAPLIAGIEAGLSNRLPIFGAGLIGDYALNPTVQFCGPRVVTQCAVGIVFNGHISPYHRITHGCIPLDGTYHRVTRAEGAVIHELDGNPAAKMIDQLYGHRQWRKATPVDLLTIGIYQGEKFSGKDEDRYVNRLITGALPDAEGICLFEPDVEEGAEIQFMVRDGLKMIESARRNSSALMEQIQSENKKAVFGLYISCAGRTAAYSNTAIEEASEVQKVLNRFDCPLFGFYSGVEIAPFLGKSRGLDWTGLLLVFTQDGSHAA